MYDIPAEQSGVINVVCVCVLPTEMAGVVCVVVCVRVCVIYLHNCLEWCVCACVSLCECLVISLSLSSLFYLHFFILSCGYGAECYYSIQDYV